MISSTQYVTRKLQIKMRYHRIPINNTTDKPNAGTDVEREEILFIAGENAKWQALWKSLAVSYKSKQTPYHPAITLLVIDPNELKT